MNTAHIAKYFQVTGHFKPFSVIFIKVKNISKKRDHHSLVHEQFDSVRVEKIDD